MGTWVGPSKSLVGGLGSEAVPVPVAWNGWTRLPLSPLQGGISDELSLSAYVTAAMLELGLSPTVRMTPSGGVGTGAGAGSPAVLGHLLS